MPRQSPQTINPATAIANMPDDTVGIVGASPSIVGAPPSASLYEPPPMHVDRDVDAYLQEDSQLQAFMNELGGEEFAGATVTIQKRNEHTRKMEWLDKLPAGDFFPQGIAYLTQYGPGDYLILVYKSGGGGIARRFSQTISKQARSAVTMSAPQAAPASAELLAITEAVKQLQQTVLALAQNQQRPQESFKDKLQELVMLRDALGGESRRDNPLEMVRTVMELARDMQPPGDGPSGMIDVAEKFLTKFGPTLMKVVETSAAQPRLQAPAQQIAPAAPGAPPASVTTVTSGPAPAVPLQPVQDGETMFQQQMIRYFLNMLIESAASDADPYTYANLILDKVPADTLEAWINEPSLLPTLEKIDSRVNQYPEWFKALREAILELKAEETDSDQPEGTYAG